MRNPFPSSPCAHRHPRTLKSRITLATILLMIEVLAPLKLTGAAALFICHSTDHIIHSVVTEGVMDKARWSQRMDARLVRHVQRRRCLWDPTHPNYSSTTRKQQVYSELARKYGAQYTAETVKRRWSAVRATFASYQRKVEASLLQSPNVPFEPSWHLWNACQFLGTVGNNDESSATLLEGHIKLESTSDADECAVSLEEVAVVNCDDSGLQENRNNQAAPNCDDIVQGLVAALEGARNGNLGQHNSEYEKVGRYVSRKLSQMDSYEAALTSSKIMEILLLYNENNPLNPNNQDVKDFI